MTSPRTHQLLTECRSALDSFVASTSAFRIVRTVAVPPTSTPAPPTPKTLFILDSSFNPPHRAHASLATSALASKRLEKYPKPHRLVLLFSVHNATKEPGLAPFEHRLAMMVVFAEDLAKRLASSSSSSSSSVTAGDSTGSQSISNTRLQHSSSHLSSANDTPSPSSSEEEDSIAIDIALTDRPYYNDKSFAMTSQTSPPPYPSYPQHIHITGFDTIIRIFTPKYYPEHEPPLSALDPFFEKHGLRVTVRPDEKSVRGMGVEEQLSWAEQVLGSGKLEEEGGKREWRERIEVVRAEKEQEGVSSTRIREAVEAQDWTEVERLCSPQVAAWVREQGLYKE